MFETDEGSEPGRGPGGPVLGATFEESNDDCASDCSSILSGFFFLPKPKNDLSVLRFSFPSCGCSFETVPNDSSLLGGSCCCGGGWDWNKDCVCGCCVGITGC